jgi:glycerophosphoryl diester phosphodiesterase family protein
MTDDTLPWEDDSGNPAGPPLAEWHPGEGFGFAWRVMASEPLVLMLLTVGFVASQFVALLGHAIHWAAANSGAHLGGWVVDGILSIVNLPIQALFVMGVWRVALNTARGRKPRLEDLYELGPYNSAFLWMVVASLGIWLGLLLFVVPGLILGLRWAFGIPLIFDRGVDGVESLRQSWILTRGHTLRLVVFGVLAGAILVLGTLVCGVGLFPALGFVTLAATHVYLRLSGQPVVEPR